MEVDDCDGKDRGAVKLVRRNPIVILLRWRLSSIEQSNDKGTFANWQVDKARLSSKLVQQISSRPKPSEKASVGGRSESRTRGVF